MNDIESVRLMALSLIDGWFRFCGHFFIDVSICVMLACCDTESKSN